MGQVGILGEHTIGNLEAAGILQLVLGLEGIEVTLFLHNLERLNRIDVLLAVGRSVGRYQFQPDGIVQTLFVNHVSDGILLTTLNGTFDKVFGLLAGNDFDAVPLLDHLFLPCSDFLGLGIIVGSQQVETLGFLVVELGEIVVELTLHRIVGSNLSNGVLDGLDPTLGIPLLVAGIEERQDFSLQNAVDSSCIELILMFLILISTLFGQRPAGTFAIAFKPPAVEYGEVDYTVHQSLLAGCSGSFERTGRCVQPDVDTRYQATGQLHVIVLKENNLTQELGTAGNLDNLLDESLTGTVVRVSLTGKEELDGIVGVVDNLGQTIEVGKQQVGTLVGSEATAETDEQRIGIDLVEQGNNARGVTLVLQPSFAVLLAHVVDQFVLQSHAGLPNHFVGHIVNGLPDLLVRLVIPEVLIKILGIELLPLRSTPSGEVYTVGNITHMIFFREVALPDSGEHFLGNLAVQPAHAVDFLRSVTGKDRHAETFTFVARVVAAQVHQVVPSDTHAGRIAAHVFSEEAFVKVIVTGRNRSMYRIQRRGTNQFDSLIVGKAFGHVVADTLYVDEGCMTFVAMIDILLDTQFLQHQDTTDTQQNFLLQTVFPIAAVEDVGDGTVELAVHFVVGIQQIEGHTTYIHSPYISMYVIVQIRNIDNHLIAVLVQYTFNG